MIEKEDCKEIAKLNYLAGILDGEGSLIISKMKRERESGSATGYGLRITVANTEVELIKWLKSEFGGRIEKEGLRGERWRDAYYWYLHGGCIQSTEKSRKVLSD